MSKLLPVLLLFLPLLAAAQPRNPDPQSGGDSLFVLERLAEGNHLMSENPEKAIDEFEKALKTSISIDFEQGVQRSVPKLIAIYHQQNDVVNELKVRQLYNYFLKDKKRDAERAENTLERGNLYYENQLYGKSEDEYKSALELATNHNTAILPEVQKQLASAYHHNGKFEEAGKLYAIVLARSVKQGDREMLAWVYRNLAGMAHEQKKYNDAFHYYERLYTVGDSLGNEDLKIASVNNMGYESSFMEPRNKAFGEFNRVLNQAEKKGNKLLAAKTLQNMGVLYQNLDRPDSAITCLLVAAKYYKASGDKNGEGYADELLANIYLQQDDLHNAFVFNEAAIVIGEDKGYDELLVSSYLTRSMAHQSSYDYEPAFEYFQKYLRVKDKLDSKNQKKQSQLGDREKELSQYEKQLELDRFLKEMNDLRFDKVNAEKDAETKKREAAEKEGQLEAEKARTAMLEALRVKNALKILEQERQVVAQEKQIEIEKRAAESAESGRIIAENQKKIEAEKRVNAEKEKRINELELSKEKSRIRNLFFTIGGLGLLILIIIVVMLQLRKKNREIAQQNTVISKNQVVIAAEKEKSDKLLLNILPESIAAELKEKGAASPRHYDNVTVLFTDFTGFTNIAEQLSPADLVATLDRVFHQMDLICEKHGLNRIKTIGDAYMAAGGLPEPLEDHAVRSVRAAIDIRDFIKRFNEEQSPSMPRWDIRIGVNSGPVVAGVVGIRKFAFDIWGDAVNVAARMESSGVPGKVNISGTTYESIRKQFSCEYRGKVSAKNKGEIDMYFVEK